MLRILVRLVAQLVFDPDPAKDLQSQCAWHLAILPIVNSYLCFHENFFPEFLASTFSTSRLTFGVISNKYVMKSLFKEKNN